MRISSSWHTLFIVLIAAAMVAAATSSYVRAAADISTPGLGQADVFIRPATPTPARPIVVGPMTGANTAKLPTVGPVTFTVELNADGLPLSPSSEFPAGARIVYAFFEYEGFKPGGAFEQVWYLNGEELGRDGWPWDQAESGIYQGGLSDATRLAGGMYRLDIVMDGVVLASGEFLIATPAPTRAPSPAPTVPAPPAPTLAVMPTSNPLPVAPLEPTVPAPILVPTRAPAPTAAPKPAAPTPQPTASPAAARASFRIVYTWIEYNFPTVWIMNLDGGEQRKLVDHASDPSWSPDGSRVTFYGYDAAPRGRGVYQVKSDGTGLALIWNEGTAQYLDWSPATSHVAMSALNSVVVYDGRAGKWTTISKGSEPSFSADGRRIVAKSCDGGDCGLFVMNRDGGDRYRITTNAEDAMPAWSPTGKHIAYANQQGGNWDLYVMNSDGSGQTRLTDDPGIDAMPAWLPDGSGIVFRSTRGGVWAIWIMNPDGTNPRKIIDASVTEDWGRSRLDVR